MLAEHQPLLAHRLTLRKLLQWCDYVHLDREVLASPKGSMDEALANLALGAQVLLLDQLQPGRRSALIAALQTVETAFSLSCAEQHAEPDDELGHFRRQTWLTHGPFGTHLSYLGFRLSTAIVRDFGRFEPSYSAVRNLARVLIARDTGHAINLVGPPGIGKSAVAEVAAQLLGRPFTRISCSRSLTVGPRPAPESYGRVLTTPRVAWHVAQVDDLFGSYRPSLDAASGEVLFLFRKGPLAIAIEQQGLILLDEINLAPSDVLGVLCALLSAAPDAVFETRNQCLCRRGTIFIAAMNDVSVGGGRQDLPRRLDELMTRVQLEPFSRDE